MVNTEKFASRLNKILEYYDLSAASFADQIEVGRSSISHILSGRNKPSLDFVMKIVKNFPEVELYWLLNGKGSFPSISDQQQKEKPKPRETELPFSHSPVQQPENEKSVQPVIPPGNSNKKIQRIVIFYSDGSFDAFEN
ncbi:helix-turn-helix domain-containing protein [Gramella sp. GC03-9]|uniref:Helix-turn-helix domain-containing protein n=1 Tax=Christiangramia oceanisediminis TaxID=2920386 RepID=A0A9X2RB71_9FLAO|nr:helix-turn-helix transcriptional regulator [Gramella oceanisediminis]MCP9200320.1 helix-turn-helix domain-containing protein [Gramella oceanisediminis]